MMPCTIDAPCGGILSLDRGFDYDRRHYLERYPSLKMQRRFSCLNGHSFYTGETLGWVPRVRKPGTTICPLCEEPVRQSDTVIRRGSGATNVACVEKYRK